jgi:Pyruvate/2-oxoacid:ferredoxin oxidoreductase delta subunit
MMRGYRKAAFYVMSGTGNTARVARWMGERAEAAGIPGRVVSLPAPAPGPDDIGRDVLVGLFTPTHGFTAPWLVISFALKMPRGRGTDAVVVSTCAGSKFGRLFLPGMEGTAGLLTALILAVKGYRVRGIAGIDMPSNWTTVHPGFTERSARAIIERARPKAVSFIDAILGGRRRYGRLVCLLLGIALLPVSAGYLLYGRFFFAKLFFADNRCTGCGICARGCPVGAIRMIGKHRPRPYWTYSCESCMRCISFCPEEAVEAGHSWAVIAYFITAVPVAQYLVNALAGRLPGVEILGTTWAAMIVQYPFFLISLVVAYALFYLVTRIPAVNALFAYTTLTRVYRRYHEPDTRIVDISARRGSSPSKGTMSQGAANDR